ncbi:MAG: hypothetical protein IKO51_02970 [Clostridia bacterium]|nr:hypothetical protein [Clostridia bacterium]
MNKYIEWEAIQRRRAAVGLPLEGKLSFCLGKMTDEVLKRRKRFAPQDGLYRGRQVAAPTGDLAIENTSSTASGPPSPQGEGLIFHPQRRQVAAPTECKTKESRFCGSLEVISFTSS